MTSQTLSYLSPSQHKPQVSIVIVAWNGRDYLRHCLQLASFDSPEVSREIIVIDNGSTDGAPEMVAAEFPDVHLVKTGENLGFAGGNNRGFALARAETVLLLNPDAFLETPGTLARLLRHLEAHPGTGAVGCRLTYPDGRHQVGDGGHAPRPAAVLVHALGLGRFVPGARGLFLSPRRGTAPRQVDWLSGALILVRADVIRQVGGLDAGFFMYAEDVEWGCRMRRAGWQVAYLPDLSAVHVQGGTQEGADISTTWLDALGRLYLRENPRGFTPFRLGYGAGFSLRSAAYGAAGLLRRDPRLRRKAGIMRRYAAHVLTMRRPDPSPPAARSLPIASSNPEEHGVSHG
ncbi:glycosyltransferase family 2 protein [Haematobacter genomosp. 1]|uniref:Glycosyl transferase n=1 Tax=Haematobacter genomosp. 1 TaxID=366618 RepID=A0A212A990_9RHOB|nr:glycosyltransferase family 2 protein [Haematobacter genomosp. 1]OWJ76566.1 glycosyl transferase [Haematobacter genomosp. 1]